MKCMNLATTRIVRSTSIVLALAVASGLLGVSALSQESPRQAMKGVPATSHPTEQARSLTGITQRADVIAVGRVGRSVSEWDEAKSSIRTRVTISVNETIKGSIPDGSLTVLIPGGEVDGVGEWYSHSVQFAREEEVVVFASQDAKGQFLVTDGEMGKFSVTKDVRSGAKVIHNVGTLDSFTASIKKHMARQD